MFIFLSVTFLQDGSTESDLELPQNYFMSGVWPGSPGWFKKPGLL